MNLSWWEVGVHILALLLWPGCSVSDKSQVDFGAEVGGDVRDTDTQIVETDEVTVEDTDPVDTSTDTAAPIDTSIDWTRRIEVMLTADDAWEMWIDGSPVPPQPGRTLWTTVDMVSVDMPGRRHVVAVHAWDVAQVISGFIAAVHVSGEPYAVTGDPRWVMVNTPPPPDWIERRFDDSGWAPAQACPPEESAIWGGQPAALVAVGAQWVWGLPCRGLGEVWLRLEIH